MSVTVLIVDDDVLVRAGLRMMIETQDDLAVVDRCQYLDALGVVDAVEDVLDVDGGGEVDYGAGAVAIGDADGAAVDTGLAIQDIELGVSGNEAVSRLDREGSSPQSCRVLVDESAGHILAGRREARHGEGGGSREADVAARSV